jgi:hypothetical protein
MAEKKQKLVLSIIEFLETSITDGSIKSDDKEGIEVASVCPAKNHHLDIGSNIDNSSSMHRGSVWSRSLEQ